MAPAPPRAAAISALGLRKSYGGRTVLDGVDLRVPEGTVFALLGPDGAGKTTTVRILSTLTAADEGEAQIAGHDLAREPADVREAIGVTGQLPAVDRLLTAEENLLFMADLHHLPRAEGRRRAADLLRRFALGSAASSPAGTFPDGMRRRLDFAMTLVGAPRVLFLDEPTTGLDPLSRRTVWEAVRGLVAEDGVTVFLTTQYPEEADQLADHIAVLDRGRVVAEGGPEELRRRVPGGHIRLQFADTEALDSAAALFGAVVSDPEQLTLQVPSDGGFQILRAVLDVLDDAGLRAEALTVYTPGLDDVFAALTGQPAPRSSSQPSPRPVARQPADSRQESA
ncbi:ATP-binding cassette domain-containing protein [Streptomyces armeniacus]|uniref:ATP-binding cassette domain-containing protein n=1 Tax=Streptomyces armeniacus TaxID=83291 RepID=A0A345Y104_9ACTN|nr:ATP-binding cassette domain-containing protein [Streptomyces armeniacus]